MRYDRYTDEELREAIHATIQKWFERHRGESRLKSVGFDVRVTFYDPEDCTEKVIDGQGPELSQPGWQEA